MARKRWDECLLVAEKMGMPLERARTLLEMGARFGDAALVETARLVFEDTGAKVDLAFSLHALARLAAAMGSDTESKLQRYGEAIALLDAVKAEYTLGLACQERAGLLEELGRGGEAQSDLVRARGCFAAVGADADKIEVTTLTLTSLEFAFCPILSNTII